MAQRPIIGLDPQFTMDEAGNLYESGTLVAQQGQWDMDEENNLSLNGQPYGENARMDALRNQGYLPVPSIGGLDPSKFDWAQLDQQLGLSPVIGSDNQRWLTSDDRNKVNEWGTQQGILQDSGGFGDFLKEAAVKIGPIVAAIAGIPGLTPGLGDAISGAASAGATGASAVSDPFIQAFTPDLASTGLFSGAGLSPTNLLQAVDGTTSAPTGDILGQYGAAETPLNLGNGVNVTNDSIIQSIAQDTGDIPAGLTGAGGNAAAITAAAGGAGVIPGITNAAGQIAGLDGVVNLANSAGGAVTPAATGSTSWLSQFLKSLGVTNEAGTMTSSPFLQGAGALLSYFQDQNRLGTLNDTLKSAADKADPFASQRGFYQDKLKQSYMDPNFFQNDPVFSGIRKTAMSDVERAAAARGYNNSSNVLHNVGSRINDEGLKYANLYQGQLAQNAGAGVSPAAGAGIQAQGAQLASGIQNSSNANIGSFLQQLPGIAKQFGLT